MERLSSSETPVLTRATRRIIQDNAIFHGHRRENLKCYKTYMMIALTEPWLVTKQRPYVSIPLIIMSTRRDARNAVSASPSTCQPLDNFPRSQ
jgi:hypothetical protein